MVEGTFSARSGNRLEKWKMFPPRHSPRLAASHDRRANAGAKSIIAMLINLSSETA
jgi:hypothetical protein